jgi:hypothetical protein
MRKDLACVAIDCFTFLFPGLEFLRFSQSSWWSATEKGFNRDSPKHLAFTLFSILDLRILESNFER